MFNKIVKFMWTEGSFRGIFQGVENKKGVKRN